MSVHPDIAGFQDLAHAIDLKSAALAARDHRNREPIPAEIAALMREGSIVGKLVECAGFAVGRPAVHPMEET